jgi:transposase
VASGRRKERKAENSLSKGQRFNLFKNPWNLKQGDKVSLKALLDINENLNSAYILKYALKNLWTYTSKTWAGKYLDKWIGWSNEIEIKEIVRFPKGLNRVRENYFLIVNIKSPAQKSNHLMQR